MAVTMERAREVMKRRVGDLPPGHSIRVMQVGSSGLWSANCVDDSEMPYPGTATVIGSDERVWVWSSNPGIHDYDLAILLLDAAYESGFAKHLDQEAFERRLADLTERRQRDVRDFLGDLRSGSLRASGTIRLP